MRTWRAGILCAVAVLGLGGAASRAGGEIITVSFTATVDESWGDFSGSVGPGTTVTGWYRYDTSSYTYDDWGPCTSGAAGNYTFDAEHFEMTLVMADYELEVAGGEIYVKDGCTTGAPPVDEQGVSGLMGRYREAGGPWQEWPGLALGLWLEDPSATAVTGTALPTAPPDVAAWSGRELVVDSMPVTPGEEPDVQVRATVDAFALGPPPPGERVLGTVPDYLWRRGCSPTAGAMVLAHWDGPYEDMWPGTPPPTNDPFDDADPVNAVIEHLGDLMGTATDGSGSTHAARVPGGLARFAGEEGYFFKAFNKYTSACLWNPDSWGSVFEGFSFEYLMREIEAGRPVQVGVRLTTAEGEGGHSVVAYGYQDNPGTGDDWFAVRDTWNPESSDGTYGVVAKFEAGREWWQWTTDSGAPYRVYRGCVFHPSVLNHLVYGLLELRFEDAAVLEECFEVDAPGAGLAEVVTLAGAPGEHVLHVVAEGAAGTDDARLSTPVFLADASELAFTYAFETPGTLRVLLDGLLVGEVEATAGLGPVTDLSGFARWAATIDAGLLGLDTGEVHALTLELAAGSTHSVYLDDLQLADLGAAFVPEPGTLALVVFGLLAAGLRRRG